VPHLVLQYCAWLCVTMVCLTLCCSSVPHIVLPLAASPCITILCLNWVTVVCLTLCCSSLPHLVLHYCASPCITMVCLTLCCNIAPDFVLQYCASPCVNNRNRFKTIDQSLVAQMKRSSYIKDCETEFFFRSDQLLSYFQGNIIHPAPRDEVSVLKFYYRIHSHKINICTS
jgi:hypothetical protein